MISVCRSFAFDFAHRLPFHGGKCRALHGHSGKLEIEVTGPIIQEGFSRGMIIDFGDLKKVIEEKVIDWMDHSYLNDRFTNPTAENVIQNIADLLHSHFDGRPVQVVRIRLYETSSSYAEWKRDR